MEKQQKELYIGPIIQSIQNSDIVAYHEDILLLLSSTKRNLLVMNYTQQTLKNCSIEDQKIVCAVYHTILEAFVINTDKRMLILNKEGQIIGKQRIIELLQAKNMLILPVQDNSEVVPGKRTDHLLYLTTQYAYWTQIQIFYQRSLLKNRSLSTMTIQLVGHKQIILYEWVAKINYLPRNKMLICWNTSEVFIFQLFTLQNKQPELMYTYDKIAKKSQNKCNCFQISFKHRFLLVGFQFGSIKVYKFDETKKYVCQLKGHQRQCISLYIPNNNHNLLYSSGLDNSIRVWDLKDLLQVYNIRLDIIGSRIDFLNQNIIFGKTLDGRKSYIGKININLISPILSEQKSGKLIGLLSDGKWGIFLYSNNMIECFTVTQDSHQSKQFNQKIQFPLKYGFLRSVIKIKDEIFAICLQKGFSIIKLNQKDVQSSQFQLKKLVYNHSLANSGNRQQLKNHNNFLEIIHEKLLDTFLFTYLIDWKNIPVSINVTAVQLTLGIILPKWDIDIRSQINSTPADYVILGSDKGYIYFVDIKNREHYYTRVSFHSEPVAKISRISYKNRKQGQLHYMSATLKNQIAFWSLEFNNPPKLWFRIRYPQKISLLASFDYFLVVGANSGQLNIFQMQLSDETGIKFLQRKEKNQQGHLKMITACDHLFINKQHIFLSGGLDNTLKIWRGSKKQLLGEIKIFNSINNLIFNQHGIEMIVCHGENCQLSYFSQNKIPVLERVRKVIEEYQEENQKQPQIISFKQFLLSFEQIQKVSPVKLQIPSNQSRNQGVRLNENLEELHFKLKYSREIKKQGFQLPEFSKSERKKSLVKSRRYNNRSMINDYQTEKNYSFLPKIDTPKSIYKVDKQSRLARMQLSRKLSFSQAGRAK